MLWFKHSRVPPFRQIAFAAPAASAAGFAALKQPTLARGAFAAKAPLSSTLCSSDTAAKEQLRLVSDWLIETMASAEATVSSDLHKKIWSMYMQNANVDGRVRDALKALSASSGEEMPTPAELALVVLANVRDHLEEWRRISEDGMTTSDNPDYNWQSGDLSARMMRQHVAVAHLAPLVDPGILGSSSLWTLWGNTRGWRTRLHYDTPDMVVIMVAGHIM